MSTDIFDSLEVGKVSYSGFDSIFKAHWGITFYQQIDGLDGFWLGFDCNHFGDSIERWDFHSVLEETKNLADQVIEWRKNGAILPNQSNND